MSAKLCLIALTAALLATAIACDPGVTVTFENRTAGAVMVDVRGEGDEAPTFDEVEAGATRSLDYLASDTYEVIVVAKDGRTLLRKAFTEEELKVIGNRIVIEGP